MSALPTKEMTSHASVETVKGSLRASFIAYALSIMMGYGLLEDRNGEIHGVGDAATLEEIAAGEEGLALSDVEEVPQGHDSVFLVKRDVNSEDSEDSSEESEEDSEDSSEDSEEEAESVKQPAREPRRVVMSDSDSAAPAPTRYVGSSLDLSRHLLLLLLLLWI